MRSTHFTFLTAVRLQGLRVLLWLMCALVVWALLVQAWLSAPEYGPFFGTVAFGHLFVTFSVGLPRDTRSVFGTTNVTEHVIPTSMRILVLHVIFVVAQTCEHTGVQVHPLLTFVTACVAFYLSSRILWHGVLGTCVIVRHTLEVQAILLSGLRGLFGLHPIQRMVDAAIREGRDLTAPEQMAWKAYLSNLMSMPAPPAEVSENQRRLLIAHRSRLRSERWHSELLIQKVRQERETRRARPPVSGARQ
jgi:hypothetical protein